MLFEAIGFIRTESVLQTEGTKVFGIELRQKLRQKGSNLEHGLGIQIIEKLSYQK